VPLESRVAAAPSPLALAKSTKNEAELAGMKKAHVRDGAAVVEFLAWMFEGVCSVTKTTLIGIQLLVFFYLLYPMLLSYPCGCVSRSSRLPPHFERFLRTLRMLMGEVLILLLRRPCCSKIQVSEKRQSISEVEIDLKITSCRKEMTERG